MKSIIKNSKFLLIVIAFIGLTVGISANFVMADDASPSAKVNDFMFDQSDAKCGGDANATTTEATEETKCGDDKSTEVKCGDGKCGDSKSDEVKCGEGKCGEGKCGNDKTETKVMEKTNSTKAATDEAKCGEGKCGNDKTETKVIEKTNATKAAADEAKCGAGKCG